MNQKHTNDDISAIAAFFKLESASGILLILAAVLAMLLANSPFLHYYELFIKMPVHIRIGVFEIAKPLLLWVNDGLMAVFFFLVGLELKREVIEGELSDIRKIILPALGAVGGMVVPAAIYVAFNYRDPVAIGGWAIPTATDIAFALGVLSLLGSRVPVSIKIFLTSLAIFDDIGAILIIAIFYTSKISLLSLFIALACILVLFVLNRRNVESRSVYMFVGMIMWVSLLKSGVHATLAGVVMALFIPMRSASNKNRSPLKELESDLHASVAFLILPVFAFSNSGITVIGMSVEQVFHTVPVATALGLFLGKQVGIFLFCWLGIRMGIARLPQGMSWGSLYGTAILCGIGFTMSLFISSLAFQESGEAQLFDERLGIIVGSLLSGVVGYLVLRTTLRKQPVENRGA